MTPTGFKGSYLDVIIGMNISYCKIKVTRLVSDSVALYHYISIVAMSTDTHTLMHQMYM